MQTIKKIEQGSGFNGNAQHFGKEQNWFTGNVKLLRHPLYMTPKERYSLTLVLNNFKCIPRNTI